MLQTYLFDEVYEGPLRANTQYGSVVEIHKRADGKYVVVEKETGEADYKLVFEEYSEALVYFRHFIINIDSSIELKEDGSIGHYPAPRIEENTTHVQLTLF